MSTFVRTDRGYFNLSKVDKIEWVRGGTYRLWCGEDSGEADKIEPSLVSLATCEGQWECLIPVAADPEMNMPASFSAEPVIAWGLTLFGNTVPVTMFDPHGVEGYYAVRRKGEDEVRSNFGDTFPSGYAWLEDLNKVSFAAE